jgi:hypothetical protein
MALKGQLSDFNLAEILQLIATQQKTGFLVLDCQPRMVFVFDKGNLISTRDRRKVGEDPLENYLKTYGFFEQDQWKHIDFIRKNSSLDLTEILISEQIMDQEYLANVLRALAVEMTHHGLKLKRGRYYFTATKDTPQGVRGRIKVDIQGLLMEAVRRLDEEKNLEEKFPSPLVFFKQGDKAPNPEQTDSDDLRLYQLALTGEPLGKIIRQGKVDSFSARERLWACCEEGYLESIMPDQQELPPDGQKSLETKPEEKPRMRSVPFSIMIFLLMLGVGYWRWQPIIWPSETGPEPTTVMKTSGEAISAGESLTSPPDPSRELRLRQIRDQVIRAAELFKYRHGKYPLDLSLLVKEGLLGQSTYQRVVHLGWQYQATGKAQTFTISS